MKLSFGGRWGGGGDGVQSHFLVKPNFKFRLNWVELTLSCLVAFDLRGCMKDYGYNEIKYKSAYQ